MRHKGQIVKWDDGKGFGFIQTEEGDEQIFLHISSFVYRQRRPIQGEKVTYQIQFDKQGRRQATQVKFWVDEAHRSLRSTGRPTPESALDVVWTLCFICILTVVIWKKVSLIWIAPIYLLLSILTFIAYARDKSAAQSGRRRTAETSLHAYAVLGGWPGAVLARKWLRHKSQKQSFISDLRRMIAINCCLVFVLITLLMRFTK